MKTLGFTADGCRVTVGCTVKVRIVDRYGYNGRDFCPIVDDLGFEGIVVSSLPVSDEQDEEDEFSCYRVCNPRNGKVLDLMSFEITVMR
jgi:hypothetical protein